MIERKAGIKIMNDTEIFEGIKRAAGKGSKAALATVTETRGSTPRHAGAKMLVLEDGSFSGSICGGCVEAEIYQEALDVISSGKTKIVEFRLNKQDLPEEGGMFCGGIMKVFIEPVKRRSK